ncbi:MAG: glycosyltransferase family 4 protein [Vicinamibacterales bacterium]
MRVLIATPEYPPHHGGGIARYYGTLAPALARAGCDVSVVVASPFTGGFESYEDAGVKVRFVPNSEIEQRSRDMAHLSAAPLFRRSLAAARAAHDAASSLGPFDIVEVTDFALQFVPFVLASGAAPVVVQCHGSIGQIAQHEPRRPHLTLDHALARLTEVLLIGRADAVQTYSSPNANEWRDRLGTTVSVLPPPVECPPALESEGTYAGEDAVVVGRIQPWKGPELLCRAMRLIPEKERPRFLWVGRDTDTADDGGSLDGWLGRQFPDVWKVSVHPVGQKSRSETDLLLRRARFVVVPSLWDVFNFTAAEAMALARLVICSDAAGASGLIGAGETGFTFASGNAKDLAQCIQTAAVLDPSVARSVGDRARSVIQQKLDPDLVARQRLDSYRDLSLRRPPRQPPAPWLREFFDGNDLGRVNTAFLDHFGIRELSQYLGARVSRRVAPKVSRRRARQ